MPSLKALKRRIASVNSTQQIMKAMDLVATSKLQKAKFRKEAFFPLFSKVDEVVNNLIQAGDKVDNVFTEKREIKSTAYVLITSDRGLCGGYNVNVAKEALSHMNDEHKNEKIIAVGSKGSEFFSRRKKNIIKRFPNMSEAVQYQDAVQIGEYLSELYVSGEVDEAYIAYTSFESVISHAPVVKRILPVTQAKPGTQESLNMIFDPDINEFFEYVIPMYLNTFLYGAIMESAACEQASRMTSMDTASNNAEEILDDLSLMYNRNRQSIITQEINEIVSGANALQ